MHMTNIAMRLRTCPSDNWCHARFPIAIYARVFPGHEVPTRERGGRARAAEQLQLRGGQPLPAQGEGFRAQVSA